MFAWWISWRWCVVVVVVWAEVWSCMAGQVVNSGWVRQQHQQQQQRQQRQEDGIEIELDETAAAVAAVEVDVAKVGPGMGGSAVEMMGLEGVQRFATQPTPQTAVVGSTAVLPCRVVNKMGQLQWTKDGFGLGTERDLFGFSRYAMIGSDDEGDFSLRILPVRLSDDGVYQCQVSASAGVPGIRSHKARLTVYVQPDPPTLSPPALTVTAGQPVTLTCQSSGGRPAPELQWIDDSRRETIRTGARMETQPLEDGKRMKVVSRLVFTPLRSHHNSTITCLASNQALTSPQSSSVQLSVLFPPEVRLEVRPPQLVEGGDVTFLCTAHANPVTLSYRWYHNSQPVANHTSRSLTLYQVSRRQHQDTVTCEVANEVGTSKQSATLQVLYGPQFRTLPRDVMAEAGRREMLTCDVDSNPSSSIVWLREGSEQIIGSGPDLSVLVDSRTAGVYTCLASVRGFPELRGDVRLLVKGPPTIVSAGEQEGRRGDTVSLECRTLSIPSPIKVTWTHKGREIDLSDPRYEVVQDRQEAGVRNVLLIHHTDTHDFGAYNCSVLNEYGIARKQIRLQEQKKVPVVMVGVGVAALAVVTLLAASVILCTRTHHSAKDDTEV